LNSEAQRERIAEFWLKVNGTTPERDPLRAQHARRVNLADWLADGGTATEWKESNGVIDSFYLAKV
jgi:hypothetical protein